MSCLLTQGIDVSCSTKTAGGVQSYVWAFNRSDLSTPIDVDSFSDVTSLDFAYGKGLLKLGSFKKSHDAGYDVVLDAASRPSYNHTEILKLYSDSSAEDQTIDELVKADDLVFIVPTKNSQFFILGAQNGGALTAGTQRYGLDNTADTSNQLTFVAEGEEYPPKRFFTTDYETTLALLESYEI